jgi:hypothetical protein
MNDAPYTYGFRALYYVNGKPVGIRGGEVPASVILIKPVQAVQEVLERAGMVDLVVRDAWLVNDKIEPNPAPIVS